MVHEVVVYTNPSSGYKEFRRVPTGLHPSDHDRGILVGPPDLTELELPEELQLRLNNLLVDAGFSDFRSTSGRRADILRLFRDALGLAEQEASELRSRVLYIYSRDYYPEKYED